MGELETRVRETAELLGAQELTGFSLSDVPPEGWVAADEHEVWLTLYVGKERIVLALVPQGHVSLEELGALLSSELGDEIGMGLDFA